MMVLHGSIFVNHTLDSLLLSFEFVLKVAMPAEGMCFARLVTQSNAAPDTETRIVAPAVLFEKPFVDPPAQGILG
jgi:hypothetical protein